MGALASRLKKLEQQGTANVPRMRAWLMRYFDREPFVQDREAWVDWVLSCGHGRQRQGPAGGTPRPDPTYGGAPCFHTVFFDRAAFMAQQSPWMVHRVIVVEEVGEDDADDTPSGA